MCNDSQVEFIDGDCPIIPQLRSHCNLTEENKNHSKIVFEYNTTDLFAIKEELQSTAGVISSSVEIHEASNIIVVEMSRTAYLNVRSYVAICSYVHKQCWHNHSKAYYSVSFIGCLDSSYTEIGKSHMYLVGFAFTFQALE